jgi:3-deoxy-D-manno-octulosonic-acid transferase
MENFFGGTETWTMTMVHAFRKLGHTTHFTGNSGKINKNFEQYYQPLQKNYDIVIINGKKNVSKFAALGKKSIRVSHGILPQQKKPVKGTE